MKIIRVSWFMQELEKKGKERKGKKKEVGCDLKLGVSCCSEGP
jgi:hypothetical protein